jgi:hypothetical protein
LSIFGEFTWKPVVALPEERALLLLHHFLLAILAVLLIDYAAFAGLFGLGVPCRPGGSLEFVDAFGIEGIGHSLTIAFSDTLVELVLVFHLNYNFKKGKGIYASSTTAVDHFGPSSWASRL